MNLQQVRYFLAAVEHGSFTAAAEALRLAPASVSEAIRRLESELGLVLFARDRRRVRLTDAGAAFVPRARHVLRAVGEAEQAMGELRSLRGGVASFGVFRNADFYDLEGIAAGFLAAHPGMRLRLFGHNSAEVADAVRGGVAEAGLVVLPVPGDDLALRPILRDEVLAVSADPGRTRRRMDVRRLAERPLVLYDAHYGAADPTRRQLQERAQQAGCLLEPVLEVERVQAALRCVAARVGDTIAASSVLRMAAPELPAIGFDPPLYDTVAAVTRRGAPLSPATRAFLAVAEDRLGALAAASASVRPVTG